MAILFDYSYEGKFDAIELAFPDKSALKAFFDSQGYMQGWKSGHTISAGFVPATVILRKGKKFLDFLSVERAPLVSKRFKSLIESIEPGVHQFFPVTVVDGKTHATQPERRFMFNVTQQIEAIVECVGNVQASGRGQIEGCIFSRKTGPWRMAPR